MDLDGIAVFVKVVQAGGFSKAARLLGMPNTTVSAKVASLEKRLGVTLIQRTTRKLNVTQAGEAYFRKCVTALEEIQAAESEVTSAQKEPMGTLRLTAGVDVAHTLLPPMVDAFLRKYPQMDVDLVITNRIVDLVAEGMDLAIRAGELEDSTLHARKLISVYMSLWASPQYLKKHGNPAHPRELKDHALIRFLETSGLALENLNGKERAKMPVTGRIQADDLETLKLFSTLGQGIALLPSFLCEKEVKAGRLVPVLPQWILRTGNLSLVYPAQKFVSPKVQAFLSVATSLHPTQVVS